MTVDLATLNLKIDSTDVAKGVGELNKLTAAGTKTEQSTNRLSASFDRAGDEAAALRSEQIALAASMTQQARVSAVANDNLGHLNRGMGAVNSASRAMRANFVNLSRQGADVVTMFALGAPPMQIFASQGLQIVDVLAMMRAEAAATNTSLGRMAAGGLARIGPYAIAAAAAGGALAVVLNEITDELNENSDVALTWQDTLLGSFDAVRSYVSGALTSAFSALGIDVGGVFDFIAAAARAKANEIIGHYVFAVNAIKAAWRTFPGAVVEFVIDAVNGALQAIERLINGGIGMLNTFVGTVNSVLNTNLTTIGEVSLPQIENTYRGAGEAAGAAMAEAQSSAYRDYVGEFLDYAQPFIEGRARDRLEAASEDAGTAAGRRMADAISREVEAALEKAAEAAELEADRIRNGKTAQAEAATNLQNKIKAEADVQARLDEEARRLQEDQIRDMANLYETLFTDGVDGVWDVFKKQGLAAISQIAAQWTLSLLSGQGGGAQGGNPLAAIGQIFGNGGAANDNGIGAVLASVTGSGGTPAGGGAAGSMTTQLITQAMAVPGLGEAVAAAAVTAVIGEGIEKLTGLRFDMLGGLFGGVIGGFAVGAIKGAVKGVATIGNDGGVLGVTDSFGKKKFRDQAESDAANVLDVLSQIADGLGTDINSSLGAVSIGTRNGKYRVDGSGKGITKTGQGAVDFGKDGAAAIEYAIRNLIEDGILGPISEASRRILTAGGDLEKAIEKAAMIEALPKLLKERLDPLGAALDTVDEQFRKLREALDEGGASAQQYADAEKLYKLEREDAIKQFGTATATLTDFLQSLAFGSGSPLSVRSQLSSAEAAFSGFEADIRAGKTVDQDKFTSAAQSLLGLSRQANGSSGAYFSTFDKVRALTQQAITNVGTTIPGEGTVFQQQTAANTQSIARMMEDQNALLREQNELLRGANDNGGKKDKFIGGKRGFG